jgi:hypothetical protein
MHVPPSNRRVEGDLWKEATGGCGFRILSRRSAARVGHNPWVHRPVEGAGHGLEGAVPLINQRGPGYLGTTPEHDPERSTARFSGSSNGQFLAYDGPKAVSRPSL